MRLLLLAPVWIACASPIPQPEIESWADASRHEELLRSDPGSLIVRGRLLSWYTRNYRDPRSAEPRLRHIFYAIQHSPSMYLIDSRSLRIAETEPSFSRARQAWLNAVRRLPADPIVRIRAAQTLMHSDRTLAASWLRQVMLESNKHDPLPDPPFLGGKAPWWSWGYASGEATRTLAQLLTDTIFGVTSRSPWEDTGRVDMALRKSSEAAEAIAEIDRTQSAALLAEGAWWLHLTSESFERIGLTDRTFVPLAWRWFQRLERMQEPFSRNGYIDGFQRYWSRIIPRTVPAPPPRVRRDVRPLNAVEPKCADGPIVNIEVIVAPDGRPRFVNYMGGPPRTERNAVKLARSWRFPPGLDGNRPVEVQTMVPVRVCLSP